MFSEDVANWLVRQLGTAPYLVLAFALGFLGPVLLAAAFGYLLAYGRRSGRDGLLFGIGVATWASLCWLVVPYCGGYPCLPGLMAAAVVFTPPIDTLPKEMLVHTVNFVVWPMAGWLFFHVRALVRRGNPAIPAHRPRE
jgi:hypothetical protein